MTDKETKEASTAEVQAPPIEFTESEWELGFNRQGQEDAKKLWAALGADGKGKINIVPDPPPPVAEEPPAE